MRTTPDNKKAAPGATGTALNTAHDADFITDLAFVIQKLQEAARD